MKMALAGKFLSVFLFLGCAQSLLVMPGTSTQPGPFMVATANAESAKSDLASSDQAKPEAVKSDSVRVLPDNFLSGNSDSGKANAEKAKANRTQPDKPQAGKPENAQFRQAPLSAKSGSSTQEAANPEAGKTKHGDSEMAQANARQGAKSETSILSASTDNVLSANSPGSPAEAGWDLMPAGARPAYMGIHGGTMPVSLLVSNDGNSLLTFVGRTGNDFLDMLRRTDLPLPSLFNSTEGQLPRQVDFQAGLAGARVLSAGSGQARMPVLCLTTDAFARIAPTPDMLQPFGLSDKPLALEGEVMPPDKTTPAKKFRMFFQPQYLQPAANRQ